MDWNAAIERNREALKRILATLVAMAAFAGGAPTLPRHLHRAVLRLLRPAEAAARRLIIVAARGLVVPPPSPSRWRKANPAPTILRNGVGTGILMPPALPGTVYFFPHNGAAASGPDSSGKNVNCPPRSTVRPLALPLLDPLRPFRHRPAAARGVPRISFPGFTAPVALRSPPSPDDPLDATRLVLRLSALASALDDLPAQAKRFARWRDVERTPQARKTKKIATPRARKGEKTTTPVASAADGRCALAARPANAPPKMAGGPSTRCTKSSTISTASPSTSWSVPTHPDVGLILPCEAGEDQVAVSGAGRLRVDKRAGRTHFAPCNPRPTE